MMMMQDSDTIEIEIGVLRELDAPGWGETKMELLTKAREDICTALAVLKSIPEPEDTHGVGDRRLSPEDRIRRVVIERLDRAKTRVDICHNELDCERSGIQPITRD